MSDNSFKANNTSTMVKIGHMGCGLVARLKPKTDDPTYQPTMDFLDSQYGERKVWGKNKDATKKLGAAFAALAGRTKWNFNLVDTMRNGSEAWRPGGFLTTAVDHARALMGEHENVNRFVYSRFDVFCPEKKLLKQFNESDMSFSKYAKRYAEQLASTEALSLAADFVVEENSRNRIPLFYCTDPYIKGYFRASDLLRTPYDQRETPSHLGKVGCHRVILAEEIAQYFLKRDVAVELYELDQHCAEGAHVRRFENDHFARKPDAKF